MEDGEVSRIEMSMLAAEAFNLAYEIDCFVEKLRDRNLGPQYASAICEIEEASAVLVILGGRQSYERFKRSAERAKKQADPGSR